MASARALPICKGGGKVEIQTLQLFSQPTVKYVQRPDLYWAWGASS